VPVKSVTKVKNNMKPEEELKLFLEQNPELKPYQMRLNREMNMAEPDDRIKVIVKHMGYNLEELKTELLLLQHLLQKLKDMT
jgi:hypothetical protein